jgi:endonuclease III
MSADLTGKAPFDVAVAMARIAEAVQPYPKAALFELFEDGYRTPFEQLLACIISIRTRDEETLVIARRLLERARTPEAVAALPVQEIEALIRPSTFYERKAPQIQAIAHTVAEDHGGALPCDLDLLLSFAGVGIKCAHLTLGIACGLPYISVDVHVHRITNRWGYVNTASPEATTRALEDRLPKAYWLEINRLLVPFGKHICTGRRPRCSTCVVLEMCQQRGVIRAR